jgi:hypothetical protein
MVPEGQVPPDELTSNALEEFANGFRALLKRANFLTIDANFDAIQSNRLRAPSTEPHHQTGYLDGPNRIRSAGQAT